MPGTRQIHPPCAQGFIASTAQVKDLPEGRRVPAILLQELGQGDDLRQPIAEQRAIVGDAGLIGAKAREERAAARIADGVLHVGPLEAHGAGGQPIEVRGLDDRMPVATQGIAEVVHDDQQNVEFPRRLGCRERQRAERDEQQQARKQHRGGEPTQNLTPADNSPVRGAW